MNAKLTAPMIEALRDIARDGCTEAKTVTRAALVVRKLIEPGSTGHGRELTAAGRAALAKIDAIYDRQQAEALAPLQSISDATPEPQYVTASGENGATWHLVDADGQPVAAGRHQDIDGDWFTIAATPDVQRAADSVYGQPAVVNVRWDRIEGVAVFGPWIATAALVDGWEWTPEFAA